MMSVKRGIVLLLALALFDRSDAQQVQKLKFDQSNYKFGSVKEENGPITHEFQFTNISEDTVLITGVKASCGCTTPAWSKEAVLPGGKGFVQARYNPRNRPGPFKKSLTVNTNVGTKILYIEGNVTPKPRTPVDDYPVLLGNLRVKHRTLNFGKVTDNQAVNKSFTLYNDGEKAIKFSENALAPAHVAISVEPKVLQPKQKGTLIVTFDPTVKPELGYSIDHMVLATDDAVMPDKKLNIMATVEEFFPPMTNEDYKRAPHVFIEENVYDFGKITSGDTVSTDFIILNDGGDVLNLRKVVANCACTVLKPEKENIHPGDSAKLNVMFNSHGRNGTQHKTITIYSNDPRKPVLMLTIKASVREARGSG